MLTERWDEEWSDGGDTSIARFHYLSDMLTDFKTRLGDRLLDTRNLFGKVALIDPHTHSDLGDGRGSVTQNYETAMACGLDFVFITDHYNLESRNYARMLEGISWGQEPTAGLEHVVVWNNESLLPPDATPETLFADAIREGRFAFIPHPAGQGEVRYEPESRAEQLQNFAGREFAMEVLNGLFKVFRAWDPCCESAVAVWDALLQQGCRVTPLGGSDAHEPFSIGTAWTGVICDDLYLPSIVHALHRGRCFASEAAMLDLHCGNSPMGSVVAVMPGQKLIWRCRAADYCGLRLVRLIADGQLVHEWKLDNVPYFEEELTVVRIDGSGYFRLEAVSFDDRRAFSAPIYLTPASV